MLASEAAIQARVHSKGAQAPAAAPAPSVSRAAAGAALIGLLVHEPRREEPLIDLRFFGSIPFASSVGIAVAAFAAFGGFLFLNTLYLQQARGLSPAHAGLMTVPVALMTVVASPLSGRIVGRRGPRMPLLIVGDEISKAKAVRKSVRLAAG